MRSESPYCDPFHVRILSDLEIARSMPPRCKPYFGLSGHMGDSGAEERGEQLGESEWKGSEQLLMEMILRLNLIYLQEAHEHGTRKYKEVMGREMPDDQLILKLRPDATPASETWHGHETLQRIASREPNAFWTSFHPVWGLQDITFITTKRILDRLTRIDAECLMKNRKDSTHVVKPEQALICMLKAVGAKVFFWGSANMVRTDDFSDRVNGCSRKEHDQAEERP